MSPHCALGVYTILALLCFTPFQVCGFWAENHFPMFISYFTSIGIRSLNVYACSVEEARKLAMFVTGQSRMTMKLHDLNGRKDLLADSTQYVQGVIIDFNCSNVTGNWINHMLNSSYTWLIYVTNWSEIDKLQDTRLNMISDVVVAYCAEEECSLYEAYRIRMTQPLKFSEWGTWKNDSFKLGRKLRKHDLEGNTIYGGIVIGGFENITGEPPEFEERSVYPSKDIFTRYHIVLYRHLEVLLNFRIVFMLRQPRALGSFFALAQPLSPEVWASIFIFIILFSVCYDVIHSSNHDKGRVSYYEGIVIVVGALAQQGLSADVEITSSRMLCFFLLFLSLILMTYYNAAIMNALLLPAPVSIRTLEQLIAPTSQVQPGLLNITYLVDNRSSYKYVLPNTVNAVKRTPNAVMDLKSGVNRVRESNFAFCAEDNLLYDQVQRTYDDAQKCDLSYIDLLKPFGLSSPIAKTSSFKEVITRGLIYLQENGLVDREKKHWTPLTPQCFGSISFFYVTLEAVGISFTIFLAGFLASTSIFIMELFYKSST